MATPQERQAPPRAIPQHDDEYFEILTKAVFQAGFSWAVVEEKWPGFRAAFAEFDVGRVASFGPPDEDRLQQDERIVRNARKIRYTIENARTAQELQEEYGSMQAWVASTADLPWPERKRAIGKPFKGVGPMGAYFFLWSVGEATPPHEEQDEWQGPVPPERALS